MFNWLKRRATAPAPAKPSRSKSGTPAPRPAKRAAAPFAPSMPLPEVVAEGNTQADWSQWEDSMTALDSQMQSLLPSASIYVRNGRDTRDTRPSQLDEVDAFASVRGRRRT
jgi:hypothetical protein